MRFGTARSKTTGVPPPVPASYEWRPPGLAFSIRLSHDLIDRLQPEVMKGFWSVPKRGAEIGGVLLGRVEGNAADPEAEVTIFVEDYERVDCEYRRGPSYVLSALDRKRLSRALRRSGDQKVVGYFRSHTRPGLYLDKDDMEVLQALFAAPSDIVLLVRPAATGPATAGFFIWEQDDMQRHATYLEFPFDRAELVKALAPELPPQPEAEPQGEGESEPLPEMQEPMPAPVASPPPAPRMIPRRSAPPPVPVSGPRPPFFARVPFGARTAALVLAILTAFGAIEYQILTGRAHHAQSVTEGLAALRVEQNGSYLRVRWNPSAPGVAGAERGTLSISDGDKNMELQLDRADLRDGRVVYAPSGNDVSFRLELHHADRTVSEAIRVITAQQTPKAKAPEPAAAKREAGVAAPAPATDEAAPAAVVTKRKRPARVFFDDGL